MFEHRERRPNLICRPSIATPAAGLSQVHPVVSVWGRRGDRDAGIVLIVMIVCLSVATAILATFVTMAVAGRASLRAEDQRLQAEWLAESAIERAAAQLLAHRDYAGESWTVDAKQLGTPEGGVVVIRVEPIADQPDGRRVSVQADFPDDPIYRCRQIKQATVQLPKPPEPPKPAEAPEPPKTPETAEAPAPTATPAPPETPAPSEPPKPAEPPSQASPANTTPPETPAPTETPKPPEGEK